MAGEAPKQQQWLEQLVGEWSYEMELSTAPDGPTSRQTGTERVRSLDGVWIVCEGTSHDSGDTMSKSMMSLGYDPAKERYVGTVIGMNMAHVWIYDGALDAAGRTLSLDTEGPSFTTEGELSKYKDTIEVRSPDERVLTSRYLGDDEKWHTFMTTTYRRT